MSVKLSCNILKRLLEWNAHIKKGALCDKTVQSNCFTFSHWDSMRDVESVLKEEIEVLEIMKLILLETICIDNMGIDILRPFIILIA